MRSILFVDNKLDCLIVNHTNIPDNLINKIRETYLDFLLDRISGVEYDS